MGNFIRPGEGVDDIPEQVPGIKARKSPTIPMPTND